MTISLLSPPNLLPPLLVTSQLVTHLRLSSSPHPNLCQPDTSLSWVLLILCTPRRTIIQVYIWLNIPGIKGTWQRMRFTAMSLSSGSMRTAKEQQRWWAGLAVCLPILKSLKLCFKMTPAFGNNISQQPISNWYGHQPWEVMGIIERAYYCGGQRWWNCLGLGR